MGNRLFTTPGTVDTVLTTHSQRDDDYHGNGGVAESSSDVQRAVAMSGFRNVVVESYTNHVHYTLFIPQIMRPIPHFTIIRRTDYQHPQNLTFVLQLYINVSFITKKNCYFVIYNSQKSIS